MVDYGRSESAQPVKVQEVVGVAAGPDPAIRAVTGTLESADACGTTFRIRDVVGNTIELVDVENPQAYSILVGREVTVTGSFSPTDGKGSHRMTGTTISLAANALVRLGISEPSSLESLLAEACQAPDPDPIDLTDEEFASFLAAAREKRDTE